MLWHSLRRKAKASFLGGKEKGISIGYDDTSVAGLHVDENFRLAMMVKLVKLVMVVIVAMRHQR